MCTQYKELLYSMMKGKITVTMWAKDVHRHFSNEDIQTASDHMGRRSTSLAVRETQVKTLMRQHIILTRRAVIETTENNKNWQGCGEVRAFLCGWEECKMAEPFVWKTAWLFLKMCNAELSCDPATAGSHSHEKWRHPYTNLLLHHCYSQETMGRNKWKAHKHK